MLRYHNRFYIVAIFFTMLNNSFCFFFELMFLTETHITNNIHTADVMNPLHSSPLSSEKVIKVFLKNRQMEHI